MYRSDLDRAKTKAIQSNEISYKLEAAKQLQGEVSFIRRFNLALAELLESFRNLLENCTMSVW